MYYPVFDYNKKVELMSSIDQVYYVFMDLCDLECKKSDFACENNKNELLARLKQKLKVDYNNKSKECEQFIFIK